VAEHSPDRHTIAVTGVGALIGQGIARSLRPAGRARIVGIDRRITPFSQSFCDICEQKPEADEASEAYLDFWRNLVRTHSIDLILPGLSVDMEFFNTHRAAFEEMGVPVALNRAELIELCADKFEFYTTYRGGRLSGHSIGKAGKLGKCRVGPRTGSAAAQTAARRRIGRYCKASRCGGLRLLDPAQRRQLAAANTHRDRCRRVYRGALWAG
jgi:hypothetical protein